ncbi:MAG: adenine phosphoribosyltransferase [Gemmatimonadetes bacterium]|nr:adenine phosphoribosyltransferase [Gemmatimonadota bacterium]
MSEVERRLAALRVEARAAIRDVADFPKPGILFRDITPLLGNERLFVAVTAAMGAFHADAGLTHALGIESRGFIFGAPIAQALRVPFIPARKPGKLPAKTIREEYALEYGSDALEIHADALTAGARVLIVDDVLATGGTALAACRLVESAGARVAGCVFLLELTELGGRARLAGRDVHALLTY